MCLAIPAKLVEYVDDERQYGKVELGGVRRQVNTSLLVGEDTAENDSNGNNYADPKADMEPNGRFEIRKVRRAN